MYFEPVCLEPSDLVPLESNTPYDCGPSLTSDQLLLYALVSKLAGLAATFEKGFKMNIVLFDGSS